MRANTPLSHVALAAILGFGVLGGLALTIDSCHKSNGSQSEQTAATENGAANAHQTQAQASDALAQDLKAKLEGAKADVVRLNAERDVILRKLAAKPKPGPDPVGDNQPSNPVCTEHLGLIEQLEAVVAKDAEVIDGQSGLIAVQSGLIGTLTTSRDEWKLTAEHREKQALAQEAATREWKKAVTSSRWLGRGEGALVGAAIGLLGGRR